MLCKSIILTIGFFCCCNNLFAQKRILNVSINQPNIDECFVSSLNDFTGINDEKIVLFPNPNLGSFYIDFESINDFEEIHIRIFNLLGECFYSYNGNNNKCMQINIAHLKDGVYIVEIQNKNISTTKKIVKY